MIKTMRIQGLGPHADTVAELNPVGTTEVVGRSECGKTTLIDAACFVLWGVDRAGAPFGAATLRGEEATAEVVTAKGSRLVRTLRVRGDKRSVRRERVDAAGVVEVYATEKAWADALGPLGRAGDVARLAMVPQSWQALALGEGGGRPLRDALLAVTARAAVDVRALVAELAGEAYREGDAVDEKGATEARRAARSRADHLKGKAEQAAEVLARLDVERPTGPTVAEVERAQAALAVWPAWTRYRAALEAREAAVAAAAGHEERAAAWQASRAAAGAEPSAPSGAEGIDERLAAARQAEREEHAELDTLRRDAARAAQRVDTARVDVEGLEAAIASGQASVCPQCGRDGWAKGQATLEQRLAETRQRLAEAEAAEASAKARAVASAARLSALTADTLDAEDVFERRQAARTAWSTWQKRVRDLGPEPVAPALPPVPEAPPGAAPELAEADARKVLADLAAARAVAASRTQDAAAAREDADRLARDHAEAEAEAARLDALLAVVRRAPSVALDRQLEALGDLGPVALIPTDKGGIEVAIDGRPWQVASDGRLVVADLWLRAGLRRALGFGWLPLFVDRVQDVGGQDLPDVGGPVVLLRTTDSDFEVRHG